ncbi:uncharacterized protein LOC142345392 [Convolutriloba macropyga]|uniref:uncharacterized protein LOC142345392 n=1 Tax=Convolutriloba macropyga TaxID=536237 RepID=UPI003F52505E
MKWKFPRLRNSFKFGSKFKKSKSVDGRKWGENGEKVTSLDEADDSRKRLCDRNHRNGISNNPEDTCLISPGWDCEKCHDEKLYLEDHHHYCAEHHSSLLWSPNSGNQQFLSGTGTACAPRVSKDGEFVPVDGGKVVVDSRVHFEMITELQQMRILCSSLQSYLRTPTFSQDASTQTSSSDSTTSTTAASDLPEYSRRESSLTDQPQSTCCSSSVLITINDKSADEQMVNKIPQSSLPSEGILPLHPNNNKEYSTSLALQCS